LEDCSETIGEEAPNLSMRDAEKCSGKSSGELDCDEDSLFSTVLLWR